MDICNLDKCISQFGKIQFEIRANTFWNWLHALSAPPSLAFTLYRVTSVIGCPSIKSLLNLIATIAPPYFFLNSTWEGKIIWKSNLCVMKFDLVFPRVVKYLKSHWFRKIFRFMNIGHLHLSFYSWIKTRHQSVYTPCDIFRYYGSFFNFPLALFGGFLTDGGDTTSAIYWWEKLFWENFWSKIFCQSWNWLDTSFTFWFPPRLIVCLHDHHDQSSYCPSSCQTRPNDHW